MYLSLFLLQRPWNLTTMWLSRYFALALLSQMFVAGVASSQSVPAEVLDDFDRLLRDRELLDQVVSARVDAQNQPDPIWPELRQINRKTYVGLPIRDSTMNWLTKPELQMSDEVSSGVSHPLYIVMEAMGGASSAAVALSEVNHDVMAGDLADRLLTQLQTHQARLRGIVRLNLGIEGAPVAALALRRLSAPPEYFRGILERTTLIEDPWSCAAAAQRLSPEWRQRQWWPTRGVDELLRAARPTSPFEHTLRTEAVAELRRRSPDSNWLEVIAQEESRELAGHLSDWMGHAPPWRPVPTELLVDMALKAALDRENKTWWTLPELLFRRAEENDYLARDTLSKHPETLLPGPKLLRIMAGVAGDPPFFLELLEELDVEEQAPLVSVALERIRGRREVGLWLAALRVEEQEYVAANEDGAYPAWVVKSAREHLDRLRQRVPPA